MTTTAWPLNAVGGAPQYSGRMLRAAQMSPLLAGATAARPLGARSGVRPGTPTSTVSVASMTWNVAPHSGILDVEAANEAGPYGYAVLTAESGAVTPAHATYTRWDGVYVQLSDPSESDGTSVPGASVVYVAGTPAAAPAMPAQPARTILLARIVVPQSGGGSPSVVWLAPQCGSVDGVPWFATTAARDAAIPAAQRRAGMKAVVGSGNGLAEYAYNGTAWTLTYEDTGWVGSGLTLTPAANWSIDSYILRRANGRVVGMVAGTYSGPTVTATVQGIIAGFLNIATLPAGWQQSGPIHSSIQQALESAPVLGRLWTMRVVGGVVQIIGGIPGQSIASGATIRAFLDHYVN